MQPEAVQTTGACLVLNSAVFDGAYGNLPATPAVTMTVVLTGIVAVTLAAIRTASLHCALRLRMLCSPLPLPHRLRAALVLKVVLAPM